jgi:hypothetical protein
MKSRCQKVKKPGMTIIEALLAIAIFVIGIQGFTRLFVKSWQTNHYVFEMGQSSFAVSQGVSKIGDYVRRIRQGDDGAFPIKSANNNDFVFFCDYNKDGITERVHLYKNGTDILMGITNPTATMPKTYPAGDQQTQTVVSRIVNDAGTPIFYYYNKDYPGDQINNPMSVPAAVADIRLMKIYLQINIDPNRAPDNVLMESFVEMRNLNDFDRIK